MKTEECSAGATWEIISDIFPRTFRILHGVAYTIAVTEVLNGGGGAMINHPPGAPHVPSDTQLNWNSLTTQREIQPIHEVQRIFLLEPFIAIVLSL